MTDQNQLYLDLSHYYDQFCSHINYIEQSEFAVRAFQCLSEAKGGDYLDLACGTGQLLQLMVEKGFTATGLDNSPEMLTQARVRCPTASLLLNDLAGYDNRDEFDLVTCFLYSMHYSHPLDSFKESIARAYRALKTGGVFMFDMVDKHGIANDAGVVTQLEKADESLVFQSRWWYRGQGEVLDLFLSIMRDDSVGRQTWNDHHTMTATDIPYVRQVMEALGFDVFIFERDYTLLREWDEVSSNVIVVGVKL